MKIQAMIEIQPAGEPEKAIYPLMVIAPGDMIDLPDSVLVWLDGDEAVEYRKRRNARRDKVRKHLGLPPVGTVTRRPR